MTEVVGPSPEEVEYQRRRDEYNRRSHIEALETERRMVAERLAAIDAELARARTWMERRRA